MRGEMLGGEMRVSPHHLHRFPATEFLKRVKRRAALHVPVRPGVPQVVPTEILDAHSLERVIPSLGADLANCVTTKAKHVRRMFPDLAVDHVDGMRVERHGYRLARFRLI